VLFAVAAVREPRLALRAGAVFLAVAAPYLVYAPPFEDWQIARFVLPGLPFVVVVCAKGIVSLGSLRDHRSRAYVVATIAAIVCAGGSYAFLQRQRVFDVALQEQRYRLVGERFAARTPPNAVAIASIHSGSLRIYAGRPTVRAELMPDGALVATVSALEHAGYIPYLALEQDEYEAFDRRFDLLSDAALDVVPEERVRGVTFFRIAIKPARR
jgi:hypothetical protein